ncbi:MAG TPA: hypothetical protein H9926_13900 [Candidatus Eisenbergiella intestinigallinarum]|uniref:Uncharacterized protein n=1 Tax=Candidatus Eisenbergiella intestinigallinarum TaxID=2838549 RepID=A0A9D2QN17_9FIRM|nr:hypothetical protein [Candidatus Eisenbergiella intestinigallinarum]
MVFAVSCFLFPIGSRPFPVDFEKVYLLVINYGSIAWALAEAFGLERRHRVYMALFCFTVIGMGCRYLLEYGEVSNAYNFTLINIASYSVLIPAGTAAAYHWIAGRLKK